MTSTRVFSGVAHSPQHYTLGLPWVRYTLCPAMYSDGDISVAVAIALAVLVLIVAFWLRLQSRDIAGYWASTSGVLYEIRPTGARRFVVQAAATDTSGAGPTVGHLSGLRTVVLSAPAEAEGRRGQVELGSRRISWRGGDWVRQGV